MGLLSYIDKLFEVKPVVPPVRLVRQRAAESNASGSGRRRIVVARNPRPYWEENGWSQDKGIYTGEYLTRYGRWQGSISVSPSGRIDVHILNPPAVLEDHSHWACFSKRKGGWYFIHPTSDIKDVSAAIISVEQTIHEAYEN